MIKTINWKIRFKNPVFLAQIGLAIILPILAYFGIDEKSITSWNVLFELLGKAFSNPYLLVLICASLWNAINDPTTKGASDSDNALNYTKVKGK